MPVASRISTSLTGAWMGAAMVLLLAHPGHAALADCEAMKKMDPTKTYEIPPADIAQCMRRGADSPVEWRREKGRSAGIKTGGGGGTINANVTSPEDSPGRRGAPASVDKNAINFSCNFPPKISLSGLKLSVSGGSCLDFAKGLFKDKNGATGDAAAAAIPVATGGAAGPAASVVSNPSCPAESDTTGLFGATQTLAAGAAPLVCGGAVALTSYELSVNANATSLASTEHGAYFLWLYEQQGGTYQPVGGGPLKLPTFLGDYNLKTKACDNQVDLPAPIAQMITYNRNASQLVLRLLEPAVDVVAIAASPPDENSEPVAPPEKFLVLPIVGGVPQIPANCSRAADYYRVATPQPDLMIDSTAADCEGSADQCTWQGANPSAASASCDLVTLPTKGVTATTVGGIDCSGKTQMAVISRPNLLYPPGTTPTSTPISGRSGVMISTVAGTNLYTPSDTLIHIGPTAPAFTLPEGGTMQMLDDSTLLMNGPATVQAASRSVLLTNGGKVLAADGRLIRDLAPGTNYTPPNPVLPLAVKLGRNLTLPAGYQVPTQPGPVVRLPIDGPK